MAKSTFRCRLITPEAQVCDDAAVSAVIPMWDGLLGVLPNRAPMVMQMGTGELRIDFASSDAGGKGKTHTYFVDNGFAQMVNNELVILAANAVAAEKLTEADAQAELSAANARKTEGLSAVEADRVRAAKARAVAKLRVAKGFRSRGSI